MSYRPDPSVPHILAKLTSLNSGEGTSYYAAVLIPIDPDLQKRIDEAHGLIVTSGTGIRSIDLDLTLFPIAGSAYLDREELGASANEMEAIDEIVDLLEEARWATPEEVVLLGALVGRNAEGEALRINQYVGPTAVVYEDGSYEYFETTALDPLLEPTALKSR